MVGKVPNNAKSSQRCLAKKNPDTMPIITVFYNDNKKSSLLKITNNIDQKSSQ
jgi:hypothetical protein